MATRQKLHEELKEILGSDHVYHNPPENIKMKYPCIVYFEDPTEVWHADNAAYVKPHAWDLTYISSDTNMVMVDVIMDHFRYANHTAHYRADGLVHDTFKIYF